MNMYNQRAQAIISTRAQRGQVSISTRAQQAQASICTQRAQIGLMSGYKGSSPVIRAQVGL